MRNEKLGIRNEEFGIGTVYLPPMQREGLTPLYNQSIYRVFAAPARAGEGSFANEKFARVNKQNIS